MFAEPSFEAQDFVVECFGEKVFLLRQRQTSQRLTFYQIVGQRRHDLRSYFPYLMEKVEEETPLIWLTNDVDNQILVVHFARVVLDAAGETQQQIVVRVARNREELVEGEAFQEFVMEEPWRDYTVGASEACDFRIDCEGVFGAWPYVRLGVAPVHAVIGFFGREKYVQQPPGVFSGIGVQYRSLAQVSAAREGSQFQLRNNCKLRCGPYLFQTSVVAGQELDARGEPDLARDLIALDATATRGSSLEATDLRTSFAEIQRKLTAVQLRADAAADFRKIVELWECGKIQIIQPSMLRRRANLIGKGAFGLVFEGVYLNFNVAIKQIEVRYADFSEAVIKEILFLGELSGWHQFLTLYGVFFEIRKDSLFVLIVTELCAYNLQTYLEEQARLARQPPPRLRLAILHNVAFGLEVLKFGITRIVHRDLKPENILVRDPDAARLAPDLNLQECSVAKISDFGVSVRMPLLEDLTTGQEIEHSEETDKFPLAGTHAYMPFETLSQGITSYSGDVYALGLIAYQLFTGLQPWATAKGPDDLIRRLKVDSPNYAY